MQHGNAHFCDRSVRNQATQQLPPHCPTWKYIQKPEETTTTEQPIKHRAKCSFIFVFCPGMERKEESCSCSAASSSFERANTALTCSCGSLPPSCSLALRSEGPEGTPQPKTICTHTHCSCRHLHGLSLAKQTPGCFCFPDRLGQFHSHLWTLQTLYGTGVGAPPLEQEPERNLEARIYEQTEIPAMQ